MITTRGLRLRATYPCRLQNTSSLHHCGQQHCQALGNFDAQDKDPQKYCIITNPILELDIIHPWSKASPCSVNIVLTSPCPQGLSRVHRGLQQSSEGSQRPPVFEYLECSEVWCDGDVIILRYAVVLSTFQQSSAFTVIVAVALQQEFFTCYL